MNSYISFLKFIVIWHHFCQPCCKIIMPISALFSVAQLRRQINFKTNESQIFFCSKLQVNIKYKNHRYLVTYWN